MNKRKTIKLEETLKRVRKRESKQKTRKIK
jgi:hypothetical protein